MCVCALPTHPLCFTGTSSTTATQPARPALAEQKSTPLAYIHPISGVVLDRLKEVVPEWVPAGPSSAEPGAQGKWQRLHPAIPYYTFPRGKFHT